MTRILSAIGVVLLVASWFGLYQLKYGVQRLDRQAAALERANAHERQTIQVLDAEWTYLNQPQRIQELSDRFLQLKPVESTQFARVSDIPFRGTPVEASPRLVTRIAPGAPANPARTIGPTLTTIETRTLEAAR